MTPLIRYSAITGAVVLLLAAIIGLVTIFSYRQTISTSQTWEGTEHRNWILVTLDTVRRDHLGCYGHPFIKTPTIDLLTRRGILFSEAVSESTWTIPAHASLLTSRWPREHGAVLGRRHLDDINVTAAELLAGKGFSCGAVVAAPSTSSEAGFGQGFHFFDDRTTLPTRNADEIIERSIAWLNNRGDERIFFWVHLFDPHRPYGPPPPLDKLYPPTEENDFDIWFKWGRNDNEAERQQKAVLAAQAGIRITSEIVARARSLYAGEITAMDAQLGRLLAFLARKKMLQNSVLTVVSDHGEFFGEQGYYFCHATFPGEALLDIPCIINMPSGPRSKIVSSIVQLVDVMPTILEKLNVSPPNEVVLSGQSLAPLIENDQEKGRNFAVSEFYPLGKEHHCTVRQGEWHYVYHRGDGFERRFLHRSLDDDASDYQTAFPQVATDLSNILEQWRQMTSIYSPATLYRESMEMTENLKSLGYVIE